MPESSKKLTILVTGGSGFIGTHLCRRLAAQGHSVRNLDVRAAHPTDIRNLSAVREACADVDAVFHLAAIASVPECEAHPAESESVNVGGTRVLLEALAEMPSARKVRVVFASSSAVYGDPAQDRPIALRETIAPAQKLSHYASHKLACEELLRTYSAERGFRTLILRFFNVFGPGQNPHSSYSGVISTFQHNLINRTPLKLHGGGEQTRDFVSVHDIVSACQIGISLPDSHPAWQGQPINLGSQISTRIIDLAEILSQTTRCKADLDVAPARPGDIRHSLADISRAKEWLNWEPAVDLPSGLAEL